MGGGLCIRVVGCVSASGGRVIDTVDTYPLYPEELRGLLEDVGFEVVCVYYDLSPVERGDAEFYTFVARRPG